MLRILLLCTALIGALIFSSTAQAATTYRPPGNMQQYRLGDGYVRTGNLGPMSITCQYRAGSFLNFFFSAYGYTFCSGYAYRMQYYRYCPAWPHTCYEGWTPAGERLYGNYNMDNRTFHPR